MTRYVQRRITRRDAVRFWSHVDTSGYGCWPWTGGINGRGYGNFWMEGTTHSAHLVALRLAGVPIPKGMEPDHLCKVRHCVRLDHLEIVTKSVNIKRQDNANRRKTHCPQGHAYDETNTHTDNKGIRHCRVCDRERHAARKQRQRELVNA